MRLQQIAEKIQHVTEHHFVMKMGDIFKVAQENYNKVTVTDEVRVRKVTRMWVQSGRIHCSIDPQIQTIRLSDGYEVVSSRDAYEVYQLQHGVMKSLAADAGESPNYIRQIHDIDS